MSNSYIHTVMKAIEQGHVAVTFGRCSVRIPAGIPTIPIEVSRGVPQSLGRVTTSIQVFTNYLSFVVI
jgi:hypothetical protein